LGAIDLKIMINERRDEEKEEMIDLPGVIDPDIFETNEKAGRKSDQK